MVAGRTRKSKLRQKFYINHSYRIDKLIKPSANWNNSFPRPQTAWKKNCFNRRRKMLVLVLVTNKPQKVTGRTRNSKLRQKFYIATSRAQKCCTFSCFWWTCERFSTFAHPIFWLLRDWKKNAVKNLPVTFLNTFVFLGKIKKLIEPFVKFLFIEKFKMWRRLVVLYKRT